MSNEFNEDTWTADQRALDGRILLEFEALEHSRATYEATGQPTEAWLATARAQAAALRDMAAALLHDGRRLHWEAELARLMGGAPAPAAEEPVVGPIAEAPAEEPAPKAKRREVR